MQPDPATHLWMHDQELKRTMRQNALERLAREARAGEPTPARRFRANPLRAGLAGLRRVLRPAGTGAA